ncbi:hypothetical protein N7507_009291 [Penicillium longicatenatum]|nr:hypothetical protein N7507_009291 [Penicillium longicatenatum]
MILVNGQCVSDGGGTDEATEQCQANNAALQQEVEQRVIDKGECATQLEQISDEKDQILLIKQQCLDDKRQTDETNEQLGTLLESCHGESTQNQEDLSKCILAKERVETAEKTILSCKCKGNSVHHQPPKFEIWQHGPYFLTMAIHETIMTSVFPPLTFLLRPSGSVACAFFISFPEPSKG